MRALSASIGFVLGIIVTALVCSVRNSADEAHRQLELLSEVQYPVRQCLDDIVKTQERGDATLAQQKVRLLRQRWSKYLDGSGRSPELFVSEVMELAPAATRPAY